MFFPRLLNHAHWMCKYVYMYLEPWRHVAFVPGCEDDSIKVLPVAIYEFHPILCEPLNCRDHLQNFSLDALVELGHNICRWGLHVLTTNINLGLLCVVSRSVQFLFPRSTLLLSEVPFRVVVHPSITPTVTPCHMKFNSYLLPLFSFTCVLALS